MSVKDLIIHYGEIYKRIELSTANTSELIEIIKNLLMQIQDDRAVAVNIENIPNKKKR